MGNKPNLDEYINGLRPNRKSVRLKAGYNSAKSGLFDNLQLSAMKQYETETYEGKTEFFATVLRVKFNKGSTTGPQVSVRARIPEVHSHLPMPKGSGDNKIIDMYPEFTAEKQANFVGLAAGQVVRVTHLDRYQTSLRYNNGRLLEMVGGNTVVSGFSTTENKTLNASTTRTKYERLSSVTCAPGTTSAKPQSGASLANSKNLEKKISEKNPRTINRSSDSSNISDGAYSPAGCPEGTETVSPPAPPLSDPSEGPAGVNAATQASGLGAGPGTGAEGNVPNSLVCSKVYTVKQTIIEIPPPVTQPFSGEQKIAKTWSKHNDKKIMTLHPKMRPLAAYFINTAEKAGYKLRITSTYRSIAHQAKLRRPRLKDPNGPINGPLKKGVPACAVPGSSPHNFGLGLDVCETPSPATGNKWGQMSCKNGYPKERWYEIGKIGLKCGFEKWGGNFRGWDPVHFQCMYGQTTYKLKKKVEKGQIVLPDPSLSGQKQLEELARGIYPIIK